MTTTRRESSASAGASRSPARFIGDLIVAIPARDEAAALPAALAAIDIARAAAAAWDPDPPRVVVAVAADCCTDETARLARDAGAIVVETTAGRVGSARAAAVAAGLAAAGTAPDACWIACTDADSVVHADWLRVHLTAARGGADLLLGSVRPSSADLTPNQLARWHRLNPQAEVHPYVHGANLGVRADAYLQVGGFADLREHEDVELVDALRAAGALVVTTDRAPVTTSGRSHGRTPGGFAAYLRTAVLPESPHR